MLDLLLHHATLPDGRTHMSVAVQDGKIVEVTAGLVAPARQTLDVQGQLLSPPFVDPHFHMDATLSYGPVSYTHLDVYKRQVDQQAAEQGYQGMALAIRLAQGSTVPTVTTIDTRLITANSAP